MRHRLFLDERRRNHGTVGIPGLSPKTTFILKIPPEAFMLDRLFGRKP